MDTLTRTSNAITRFWIWVAKNLVTIVLAGLILRSAFALVETGVRIVQGTVPYLWRAGVWVGIQVIIIVPCLWGLRKMLGRRRQNPLPNSTPIAVEKS
jgi:hypothetical protein